MNANPRYEDQIVIAEAAPRQVNTRHGQKVVWDVKSGDGRRFQTWDNALGMQAANLLGQQVRVVYQEKPSSDPSFPPNLQLETLAPMGMAAAAGTVPQTVPQPQTAPQPVQQAPQPQQPLPAAQGTPGAGTGGGPSEEDKQSMRRSAAVKAAAYLCAGDTEIDFWRVVDQILTFIETGNDPIPFLGGGAETPPDSDQDIPY